MQSRSQYMEDTLKNLLSSVAEYPLIALLLYFLAVLQWHRILLWVSLFLASCIIATFIVYPEVYLRWFDWALTGLNLLPKAKDYDLPAQYLGELQRAYIKGLYVASTVISGLFMVLVPFRKLNKANSSS